MKKPAGANAKTGRWQHCGSSPPKAHRQKLSGRFPQLGDDARSRHCAQSQKLLRQDGNSKGKNEGDTEDPGGACISGKISGSSGVSLPQLAVGAGTAYCLVGRKAAHCLCLYGTGHICATCMPESAEGVGEKAADETGTLSGKAAAEKAAG